MNSYYINDNRVTVTYSDGTSWELPISEIALIGEYSTQEGPGSEDHFICIIDKEGNRYDVGADEGATRLLSELSIALGVHLEPKLILNTDFNSCILYPCSAHGSPLFVRPPKLVTFMDQVKSFFRRGEHELRLSDEAEALIQLKVSTSQ